MGQTLSQWLWRGSEPTENKYFNPIKAKIGASFTLDLFEKRGLIFTLREIVEYKRTINGKVLTFGDYVLLARPIGKEDVWARLRFMPVEIPDSQLTHTILLLDKYDEMPWNQGLDEACRSSTGELVVTCDNEEERYWRLNGLKESYHAKVALVRDADNNGKVEDNEVEKGSVEYWDYSRDTLDEAGQRYTQYLFVELDCDSKMQTIWRGVEVDPNHVSAL